MRERETYAEVVYLSTLQFAYGGLLDAVPTDNLAHLIRGTRFGTPGPTLCGIDRFAPDSPGWSVGGGMSRDGVLFEPCSGCVEAARRDYPGLPVAGIRALAGRIAEELGVPAFGHSNEALKANRHA